MASHATHYPSLQLSHSRDEWPFRVDLGDGLFALVDEADFGFISQWSWNASRSSHGGRIYARRARRINGKHYSVLMHRFLMFPPSGMVVDHKNYDTLDNRKNNLRVCTQFQNATGRAPVTTAISGYRGVSARKNRFYVQIKADGDMIYGGSFVDPIIAARTYDALAVKYKGDFAILNFPEDAR